MSTTHSEQNQQKQPRLSVVPYLAMDNATAALAFYQQVFDAKVSDHHMAEDGKRVTHATLLINGGRNGLEQRRTLFNLAKSVLV